MNERFAAAPSKKNAFRDLKRAIGYPKAAPPIEWIDVNKRGFLKPHPILCPIDTFCALISRDEKKFNKHVRGDEGSISELWAGLRAQNDILYTANAAYLDDPEHTLGLGIHGDGAPTHKTDGLFTISWGSLTAGGSTIQQRFVYTVVRKSDLCDGTLEALFDRLAWACNAMLHGKYPSHDWKGKPHPKAGQDLPTRGWKAAVLHLRGDWEFYQQVLGFPAPNSVPNNCFICWASPNVPDLAWSNARDTAGWRPTVRTHESYVAELLASGRTLPTLFRIITLRIEGIMIDVLHCVDQGVAMHLIANVFIEVMALGHWGPTQQLRAAGLDKDMREWQKAHGERSSVHGEITFSRIRTTNDWPKLKCKASATRHLIDYTVHLSQTHMRGGEHALHDQRRLAVCQLLQRFYRIIADGGRFLCDDAKLELPILVKSFMGLYGHLPREALNANVRAWKMVPKFHMFVHLCEIQSFHMNPRFYWVYMDEDMQKQIKAIALTCHHTTVDETVMYKWVLLIFS